MLDDFVTGGTIKWLEKQIVIMSKDGRSAKGYVIKVSDINKNVTVLSDIVVTNWRK